MKAILCFLVLFSSLKFYAQDTLDYTFIPDCFQQLPRFNGGNINDSLSSFFIANIVYPDSALDYGVEARIFVSFYIDSKSQLSGVNIFGTEGFGFAEEVERVMCLTEGLWSYRPCPYEHDGIDLFFRIYFRIEIKEEWDTEDCEELLAAQIPLKNSCRSRHFNAKIAKLKQNHQ